MLLKAIAKIAILGIVTTLYGCQIEMSSADVDDKNAENTTKIEKRLTQAEKIVLADLSDRPARKIAMFQPVADYLAAELSEFDIKEGEVKIAQDFNTIAEWLETGAVDIYFDSVYPAMIVSSQSGAYPILRRWKKGHGEYYTVLIAMKDKIQSLEDLKGKTIAFDDRHSTSGYMLPAAYLTEAGFDLEHKKAASHQIEPDKIGYIFSRDDENSIQWIIGGKVAAAAVDNQTFAEIPLQTRQAMVILAKSELVPRQVVLVSPTMSPELVERVKQVLINMDRDPQAENILRQFEQTKKFDELPSQTSFERMQEIYQLVQQQ